jgi:hypothetical protein
LAGQFYYSSIWRLTDFTVSSKGLQRLSAPPKASFVLAAVILSQ